MSHRHVRIRQQLEALEELGSEVARLRRGVRHLESRCTAAGISRYGMPTGAGMEKEDLWIRLCDQRTALTEKESDYRQQEARVQQWIDQLPRPRWRLKLKRNTRRWANMPA